MGALSPDVAQYEPGVQGANADKPVVSQKLPIGLDVKLAMPFDAQYPDTGHAVVW